MSYYILIFSLLNMVLLTLISVIFGIFLSTAAAISCWLGGVAVIIPDAIFGLVLFKETRARALKRIVKRLLKGELYKLILIGALSLIFLKYFELNLLYFLIGLTIALIILRMVLLALMFTLEGKV